jgi:hypothetical protein
MPILCALCLFSCSQAQYAVYEKMGYAKREVLADRVENARDAQNDAKEQFASALDQFRSVVEIDGGELEEKYDILKSEYDRSEAKAKQVTNRIELVEDVAEALFNEWEQEITQYQSASLRRSSAGKLNDTKRQYDKLIRAMWKAEGKIDPVLAAFNDQVLFLKHNLNAQAVASLEGELTGIQSDVDALIREMNASIAEADSFIGTLASGE